MTVATLRRRNPRLLLDWTEQAMLQKRTWRKRRTSEDGKNGLSGGFARSVAERTTRSRRFAVPAVSRPARRRRRDGPAVRSPASASGVVNRATRTSDTARRASRRRSHWNESEVPNAWVPASASNVANQTTLTHSAAAPACRKPAMRHGSEGLTVRRPASVHIAEFCRLFLAGLCVKGARGQGGSGMRGPD